MFIHRTFEGNIDDPMHVMDVFNRHNTAVKETIGPDRLLVYPVGSGWVPLPRRTRRNLPLWQHIGTVRRQYREGQRTGATADDRITSPTQNVLRHLGVPLGAPFQSRSAPLI